MATFNDLPNEVLLQIAQFCMYDQGRRKVSPLASLSVVERRLQDITAPLLYNNHSTSFLPDHFKGRRKWRTALWLRTLLESPERAKLVRTIDVTIPSRGDFAKFDADNPDLSSYYDVNEVGAANIQETIDHAFGNEEALHAQWIDSCITRKASEFIFALTIARIPNLHFLKLIHNTKLVWQCLDVILDGLNRNSESTETEKPLQALRTVQEGPTWFSKYPDNTQPLAFAAKWPRVRTIAGGRVADPGTSHEDFGEDFSKLEPKSGNFKHIRLRTRCQLEGSNLQHLVGAAKRLETFDYHIGHCWAGITLRTDDILRALLQQAQNLCKLTLHLSRDDMDENDTEANIFEPMDFSAFAQLKQLEISFALLFGHFRGSDDGLEASTVRMHVLRALPDSLARLAIVQCRDVDEATVSMAALEVAQQQRRFPLLEKIVLGVYIGVAIEAHRATRSIRDILEERSCSGLEESKVTLMLCADCYSDDEGLVVVPFQEIPYQPGPRHKCCYIHEMGLAPH